MRPRTNHRIHFTGSTLDLPRRARLDRTQLLRAGTGLSSSPACLPTACIVLALVGFSARISAKKGGKSAGFVLTIVLVFGYYFVSLLGLSLARQGKVPRQQAFG